MQEVLTIPVGSAGEKVSCLLDMPTAGVVGKKPLGYVLDCKGVGWDLSKERSGRRSFFNRVMWQIENAVAEQGFALVHVSPSGYSGSHMSALSLDKYINDLSTVVSHLERVFGERLAAMGHSLGAYVVARLAMAQHENPIFSTIALLSPPLAPKEAVDMFASVYKGSPMVGKHALAAALATGVNLWATMAYLSNTAGLPSCPVEALVDSVLAAPALDELVEGNGRGGARQIKTHALIVYGGEDHVLFPQPVLRLARKQSREEFESRWKRVATNAYIVGYEGLGHNFTTGVLELLTSASPLNRQPLQVKEIGRTIANHFKEAYATTR